MRVCVSLQGKLATWPAQTCCSSICVNHNNIIKIVRYEQHSWPTCIANSNVAGQSNEDKEGEKDGIDEAQEEGHQMLRFL